MTPILRIALATVQLVALLVGTAVAQDKTPLSLPPQYFGMHIHNADTGTPWPGRGVGAWRLLDARVNWFNLQPEKGRWDFQKLDRLMAIASLTKAEVLLPLAFPPRWATARPDEKGAYGMGSAAEPRDMEDWRVYVRTVVQRYKGRIKGYEIWNEPMAMDFFSGTPEALVALQKEAYQIIKTIDPDAIVVSAAVGEDAPKALEWFRRYVEAGAARYADVTGYHYYFAKTEPEAALGLTPKLRAILTRYGASKPIWNTEAGWQIENEDGSRTTQGIDVWWKLLTSRQAASYVIRALLVTRLAGAERYYWYSWDHKGMGLMEPATSKPKLAGRVYAALSERLAGGAITSCQQEGQLWRCALVDKNGESMLALWARDGQRGSVTARSEWGNEIWRPVDETSEKVTIGAQVVVTSEPIFFVSARR